MSRHTTGGSAKVSHANEIHVLEDGIQRVNPGFALLHVPGTTSKNPDEHAPLRQSIINIHAKFEKGEESQPRADDAGRLLADIPSNEVIRSRSSCTAPLKARFEVGEGYYGYYIPPQKGRKTFAPRLYLSGYYDVPASEVVDFGDADIRTLSSGYIPLGGANAKQYTPIHTMPEENVVLLATENRKDFVFLGENCRIRAMSSDECRISAGNNSGYVIFRLRKDCVALYQSANSQDVSLVSDCGIYVVAEKDVGSLAIHDLSVKDFNNTGELKHIHLDEQQCAFYYTPKFISDREKLIADGEVQSSKGEMMPLAEGVGVHLLYIPEGTPEEEQWRFHHNKKTRRPVIQNRSSLVMDFELGNYKQSRVNVPDSKKYYYIENYGSCCIFKLPDGYDTPSKDNIKEIERLAKTRANMAYVRHEKDLYFINFRLGVCLKQPALDMDKINRFDEYIEPSQFKARDLTDQELNTMEEILGYPMDTMQKMSVIGSLRGRIEKELYYNPHLMSLILPDSLCAGNEKLISFNNYVIVEIPNGSVCITKLKGKARRIKVAEDHQSEFRVYNSNRVLIDTLSEDFVGICATSHPEVEFNVSAITKDDYEYKVSGKIDYFILNVLQAVEPFLTTEEGVKSVSKYLTNFVNNILTTTFNNYIEMHRMEDLEFGFRMPVGSPIALNSSAATDLVVANDIDRHISLRESAYDEIKRSCEARGLEVTNLFFSAGESNKIRKVQEAQEKRKLDHQLALEKQKAEIANVRLQQEQRREDARVGNLSKVAQVAKEGVSADDVVKLSHTADRRDDPNNRIHLNVTGNSMFAADQNKASSNSNNKDAKKENGNDAGVVLRLTQ